MNKVCISGIYFIFIIFLTRKKNYFGLAIFSFFSSCSFVMECTWRDLQYTGIWWIFSQMQTHTHISSFVESILMHATVRQDRMTNECLIKVTCIQIHTNITLKVLEYVVNSCCTFKQIVYAFICWRLNDESLMLHNVICVMWIKLQSLRHTYCVCICLSLSGSCFNLKFS